THWALSYINSAATRGWVQGFPDGTFRPDERTSRAQVVTVINRMLQRILHTEDIPEDIATFTDLPRAHWAYADIVEASTDHDRYNVAVRPDGSEIWSPKAAATSEASQSAA
ncbi:MAG: S-layer homology domain-containing protein, partial [Oscillospiraceae bacterium]|nr:S-layer homology domain-containing protein [Oscillospiraceae bacterium]